MGLFKGTVTYGTQIYDHQYFASQLHNEPSVCQENFIIPEIEVQLHIRPIKFYLGINVSGWQVGVKLGN